LPGSEVAVLFLEVNGPGARFSLGMGGRMHIAVKRARVVSVQSLKESHPYTVDGELFDRYQLFQFELELTRGEWDRPEIVQSLVNTTIAVPWADERSLGLDALVSSMNSWAQTISRGNSIAVGDRLTNKLVLEGVPVLSTERRYNKALEFSGTQVRIGLGFDGIASLFKRGVGGLEFRPVAPKVPSPQQTAPAGSDKGSHKKDDSPAGTDGPRSGRPRQNVAH
jgi:hypothetical protein